MKHVWNYLHDPQRGRHVLEGLFPILLGILIAIAGSGLGVYLTGVPVPDPWSITGLHNAAHASPAPALERDAGTQVPRRLGFAWQPRRIQ